MIFHIVSLIKQPFQLLHICAEGKFAFADLVGPLVNQVIYPLDLLLRQLVRPHLISLLRGLLGRLFLLLVSFPHVSVCMSAHQVDKELPLVLALLRRMLHQFDQSLLMLCLLFLNLFLHRCIVNVAYSEVFTLVVLVCTNEVIRITHKVFFSAESIRLIDVL